MEIPVTFKSEENQLYGMVHIPEPGKQPKKAGVIFLPSGVKYRVGPHRLYVKLARQLQAQGYPCLRVDTHGIGDSEGELERGAITNVWSQIETGRFVDDTLAAIAFFCREYELDEVVLSGLCGGANTSLLAATGDRRVSHLILLGLSTLVSQPLETFSDQLNPGIATVIFSMYLKKIFNLKYWFRLLTFQSDYRLLFKSISMSLLKRKNTKSEADKNLTRETDNRFNKALVDSIHQFMTSKKNILFIMSEHDPALWNFTHLIQKPYLESDSRVDRDYEVAVISSANHMLFLPEWQAACSDKMTSWLNARYP
ncbi:alpha/beta hydrolase [candidate division KSB1 bacterium]|nr:alpha/beta hydrolase [candidate division KSB1 bacterium]